MYDPLILLENGGTNAKKVRFQIQEKYNKEDAKEKIEVANIFLASN